ncbi:sensor histidine kinase [Sunxiuqinia sp. A32]|uniref:sensor histidine kinase n=1 Tax=Sunxiuqinia sp. A32 TaxID=3461496 RepID=UPI00404657C9
MKQLLFILFTLLTTIHISYAQDVKPYEKTTWNVIRERLFNGENAKAYRFEDDIRFKIIGAKNYQDSAIFTQMISELNELLETVKIKMVDTDPNFRLTIVQEPGVSANYSQVTSGSKIVKVYVELGFPGSFTDKESVARIYFFTIRNLTKLYAPQYGSTGYGGVFAAVNLLQQSEVEFNEVDKDLLKKLYSQDFYKQLKERIVEEFGYEFYLNLRYQQRITNFSYALKAILLLFGFLFFLSKESKRKENPCLFLYIKQRTIILLILPFFFSAAKISGDLSLLLITRPVVFIANFLITVIFALMVLVFIYYAESKVLKRINNFAGKQAYILLTTISSASIVPVVLILLYSLLSSFLSLPILSLGYFWSDNSSWLFLIIFIAAIRVFYNFINYRIQSMVNQKDVEFAKMKELKNQAELDALHSRINPHFLYNSLNSIASLAHVDADKTESMATGLSELFRYSINKENKTYVSVDEELEMVKKYLEIEKIRFGSKLEYEINADENTLEKMIPKFLIQPLVENAIKHGLSKIKSRGKIAVEVKQQEKDLSISIFDNGPDFPAEPVSGYGLQNLHDKLDIIYGNDAIINWENGANKNVNIILNNQLKL